MLNKLVVLNKDTLKGDKAATKSQNKDELLLSIKEFLINNHFGEITKGLTINDTDNKTFDIKSNSTKYFDAPDNNEAKSRE